MEYYLGLQLKMDLNWVSIITLRESEWFYWIQTTKSKIQGKSTKNTIAKYVFYDK